MRSITPSALVIRTRHGPSFYRDELRRRQSVHSERVMTWMTVAIAAMTFVIVALTVLNVIVVAAE